MKGLAIITQNFEDERLQWQYDKIVAAIAYEVDLTVVFVGAGIYQLTHSKAWRTLEIFGVEEVYYQTNSSRLKQRMEKMQLVVEAEQIESLELKKLIAESDYLI